MGKVFYVITASKKLKSGDVIHFTTNNMHNKDDVDALLDDFSKSKFSVSVSRTEEIIVEQIGLVEEHG